MDIERLKKDKDLALHCMFAEVPTEVAEDVRLKVNAYSDALLARLEKAETERDKEAILKRNFEGSWRETDKALLAAETALRSLREAAQVAHDWLACDSLTMTAFFDNYGAAGDDIVHSDDISGEVNRRLAAALAGAPEGEK